MLSFIERFKKLSNPFCLGLDPSNDILNSWGFKDDINGLERFCDIIKSLFKFDDIQNNLHIVKIQHAFFERFGSSGIEIMISMIRFLKQKSIIVIVDCKKTDIGHTAFTYIKSFLDRKGQIGVDAMTFVPFLGINIFTDEIIDFIEENKAFIFIVTKSSNPEGEIIQDAKIQDGRTVAEYISDRVREINMRSRVLGSVIGATLKKEKIESILNKLENTLILSPGIGAQGASYYDILENFSSKFIITPISRGILKNGPNLDLLRDSINREINNSKALIQGFSL